MILDTILELQHPQQSNRTITQVVSGEFSCCGFHSSLITASADAEQWAHVHLPSVSAQALVKEHDNLKQILAQEMLKAQVANCFI